MAGKKYTLILVPETHWDRDWYSTFQEFRIRLVRLTDKLLNILDNDKDFKSFTFDGQTVVLEDYLEIRPQERERIKKHVRKNRLLIGPWYILPDEFLVSAEATVRNLMLGHMIGEEFGRPMKAGYIPDPFGHLSQLPQILAGFDIPSVYFTRGMGDEADEMHSEFWWEASDGTRTLAVNQVNGYCNALYLGYEDSEEGQIVNYEAAVQRIREQLESLSKKASTRYLLLNNGCDHVEPQPELPEIIKYINEHLEEGEVVHSTYEDLAARILAEKPELKIYRGELHSGKFRALLLGVFSARMYIKQANERTQTLLEKWAEPASAMAWLVGGPYENQILWEAWKLLIKNHPHDSICGCSIDQVHKEMMVRFDQSQQIGEALTNESLRFIADRIDTRLTDADPETRGVVAFNPHAWDYSGMVKARMAKNLVVSDPVPRYVVKDSAGNVLPAQVTGEYIEGGVRQRKKWYGDVCFLADNVPSLGHNTFYIEPGDANVETKLKVGLDWIENDFIRLNVRANGAFDLYHKPTRTTFHNLNVLEDSEDVGDEYNYGWAYSGRTISSEGVRGTLSVAAKGPVFVTLRADFTLMLPESIREDRLSRSEELVACPVKVFITVHANSPRVDIVTEFENNAKDHRLRAHFPTGIKTDVCYAEGQYDVVERSLELPSGEGWVEKPVGQKPVQSYVIVDGTDGGLAVINQGMPEYEVLTDEQCTIAQTLLRCCGWLSRNDYEARPYSAGPAMETPEAQCIGKQVFRYAVLPTKSNWSRAKVWRQAHEHNARPRTIVTGLHRGELPLAESFVEVGPDSAIVTALKKAEKSDALIVRVLNTTPEEVEATISLPRGFSSAHLTNLNEEPIDGQLASDGGSVKFPMPGFRVQTVAFTR